MKSNNNYMIDYIIENYEGLFMHFKNWCMTNLSSEVEDDYKDLFSQSIEKVIKKAKEEPDKFNNDNDCKGYIWITLRNQVFIFNSVVSGRIENPKRSEMHHHRQFDSIDLDEEDVSDEYIFATDDREIEEKEREHSKMESVVSDILSNPELDSDERLVLLYHSRSKQYIKQMDKDGLVNSYKNRNYWIHAKVRAMRKSYEYVKERGITITFDL